MFNFDNYKNNLLQIAMIISVLFIFHILLGVIISGVILVLYKLGEKNKIARWIILSGLVVSMAWLVFLLPEAQDGVGVSRLLYLGSLDHFTGLLKGTMGLRGETAFKLVKVFLNCLPVTMLTVILVVGLFFYKKRQLNNSKGPEPLFRWNLKSHQKKKLRNSDQGAFIGVNTDKKPVYLTDYERGMHTQVIGSTGFGKTSSVLMPLLAHDLKQGKSVIFIDGKGDCPSLSTFISLVRDAGRENDTYIFAPSYPNISNSWNPLASGNPVVRKDRIVGAQIWSEEFYKKKGEDLLQSVLHVFDDLKITPSFPLLAQFLKDPDVDFIKNKKFRSAKAEEDYKAIKLSLKNEAKIYAGIISDINLFAESFLKPMLTGGKSDEFNLYDVAMNGKVVYFNFPVLMMEETMKRLARMVIHDLKTVASVIQNYDDDEKRRPISVFLDEFGSFAETSFIELLNKARSSGMGITIIHQSWGDIEGVDKNFARQINENTNIKISLRVDDPATIEQLCRMAGTHQEKKYTYQTISGVTGQIASGGASMREVESFNIDPNIFRRLGVGEAVIMKKTSARKRPEFHTVKLDYVNPPKLDLSVFTSEARQIVIDGGEDGSQIENEENNQELQPVKIETKPVTPKIKGNVFPIMEGCQDETA